MATESYFDFVDTLQKEIESDTGIKFGVIEEFTFSDIVIGIEDGHTTFLGQEKSSELYKHFTHKGYIDSRGKVQDLLRIDLKDNNVDIPEVFTENPTCIQTNYYQFEECSR